MAIKALEITPITTAQMVKAYPSTWAVDATPLRPARPSLWQGNH
jgi:hypothetical protein